MRTLRLAMVGTVILTLLGGPGGAVLSQSEGEGSAEWLTFVEQDCTVGDHEPATVVDGVEHLRGMPSTCDIAFSDPRLSGVQSNVFNQDCFPNGICVYWGSQDIAGPDGTWTGWFTGTIDREQNSRGYIVLTGSGAYEGLTNVRHAMGPVNEPPIEDGVIFIGDPPPVVIPPVEPVLLQLTFDGESCTYEGPTELSPGPVELRFRNESDGAAATNMVRINEGHTIQDMINYGAPYPTTKHAPAWTRGLGTWRRIAPGDGQQWEGDLRTGLYFIVCARLRPLAIWSGTGLTVSD